MSAELPRPFGTYTLLKLLARGGMGEIYLARTAGITGFEKYYAVKKLLKKFTHDNDVGARFIDEAKLGARLQHPNIVQVYDLGRVSDELYMATEFVDGFDLRRVLRFCHEKKKRIPLDIALFIVREILSGLAYAHRQVDAEGHSINLIHRDISPQNVLVSFEGEVKIIDFGLAKSTQRSQETQANVLLGNFGYMSPEQARGHQLDVRTDVYSAGIVLFELVTGTKRFVEENPLRLLEMVARPTPIVPSDRVPGTPKTIDKIYSKATAPAKDDRFENAEAFRDDVTTALHRINPKASRENLAQFLNHLFLGGAAPAPVDSDALDKSVAVRVRDLYDKSDAFQAPAGDDIKNRSLHEFSDDAPQTASHPLMRQARAGDMLTHQQLTGEEGAAPATGDGATTSSSSSSSSAAPAPSGSQPPAYTRGGTKPGIGAVVSSSATGAAAASAASAMPAAAAPSAGPPSATAAPPPELTQPTPAARGKGSGAQPVVPPPQASPPLVAESPVPEEGHVPELSELSATALREDLKDSVEQVDAVADASELVVDLGPGPMPGTPTSVYDSPEWPGQLDAAVAEEGDADASLDVQRQIEEQAAAQLAVQQQLEAQMAAQAAAPPAAPPPTRGTGVHRAPPPSSPTSPAGGSARGTVVTTVGPPPKRQQPSAEQQPSIVISMDLDPAEPTVVGAPMPSKQVHQDINRTVEVNPVHVDKNKSSGGFGDGAVHESLIIDFEADGEAGGGGGGANNPGEPDKNIRPAAQPLGRRVQTTVAQPKARPTTGTRPADESPTSMPPPNRRRS